MEYDRWYYYSYVKISGEVSIWIDGVKDSAAGIGVTSGNSGPLYIGGDPWYNSLTNVGYDNFQFHMKALSETEIKTVASGAILYNEALVIAYDFGSIVDNIVKDISGYGNDGTIVGYPTFPEGGAPEGKYQLDLPGAG